MNLQRSITIAVFMFSLTGCDNPVFDDSDAPTIELEYRTEKDYTITLPDGQIAKSQAEFERLWSTVDDYSENYNVSLTIDPRRDRASKESKAGFSLGDYFFQLRAGTHRIRASCIQHDNVPHVNIELRHKSESIINIHLAAWIDKARGYCTAVYVTGKKWESEGKSKNGDSPCWSRCTLAPPTDTEIKIAMQPELAAILTSVGLSVWIAQITSQVLSTTSASMLTTAGAIIVISPIPPIP